ncbi:MAG: hydrogenase maturation nickel metallochaperone HypA [Lachnospiraceae bacterium]|nr:hydrogenase maturation nickel metallochaperone HypA [Lachnospiraceae bacterium]
MHELVIVEGILEAVIPAAKEHKAEKIVAINLKVGELSGVVSSCVLEYFKSAAKGTIAEGAKINVLPIPVAVSCPDCGYQGGLPKGSYHCPSCGSAGFKIVSGREYYVDTIEAE